MVPVDFCSEVDINNGRCQEKEDLPMSADVGDVYKIFSQYDQSIHICKVNQPYYFGVAWGSRALSSCHDQYNFNLRKSNDPSGKAGSLDFYDECCERK